MGWNDIETNNNGDKTPFTKFGAGTTLIRILDEEPYSFWQHWIPASRTSAICSGSKDCPVCHVIAEAKANKVDAPYNNQHRHAMRVWNYNTNQMEIMIQGKGFMTQILALHKEVGDIRNYDIKVLRSGEGLNTNYTILPTAESEFDKQDMCKEINFADVFKPQDKDVVIAMMEGRQVS